VFSVIKQLYEWILHWAQTPYGPIALFLLSYGEALFFPVPPDVLLIALSIGLRRKAYYFALICSLASILGGLSGYFIGYYLWWNGDSYTAFADFFFTHVPGFSEILFINIQQQYNIYGFLIIFAAGFTPIPYKLFTITAGAFNISFPLFLFASTVSRSARFFIVSWLIIKFGDKINNFIYKYFNLLTIAVVILIIIGYIMIKYVFIR